MLLGCYLLVITTKGRGKKEMKKFMVALLSVAMSVTMLAGCGSSSTSESTAADASTAEVASSAAETEESTAKTEDGGKYKIAVSNAYMGNDWRQLMIKCLEVAAEKDAYKDKIELTITNSENSAEAQASAIDAMVEQGYDAILIDASSSTALIPAINRALEKDIVVVTFDSVVDADGVYTVQTDLEGMSQAWAEYLVEKCGEGAKIAVDTGMPGATNGNTIYEAAMAVFEEHNMNVVSEFASEFADGVCQEQLASVLAANPDLEGIFCQAYVESCYAALTQAGMDLIPISSFDTNLGMVTALENNMNVIIGNNCPGIGVIALETAVQVLDGNEVEQDIFATPGMFVTEQDKDVKLGLETTVIEEGVNCWKDQADGLDWPALPDDFTAITIDVDEISDFAAK